MHSPHLTHNIHSRHVTSPTWSSDGRAKASSRSSSTVLASCCTQWPARAHSTKAPWGSDTLCSSRRSPRGPRALRGPAEGKRCERGGGQGEGGVRCDRGEV